ncbi:TfuA domain-containing protein [Anaeromyxobacter sp. Fw109-5]|uniref:TfuA domain-containing protein n=1 Tax=Anaeromyxobacter sp. (strain Fw109-5) TaxID=404589 RepID=UPI0000ED7EC1|nr:TfuA domain-containing protein [Anaeromyxobacter sp. Fw109-5]ABS25127.1 TfuA domain protein core [Anaeromyxobacter sp. Fw109-5]
MTRARRDDLVVFLGPSLPPAEARRLAPCRVLPPARAGDVLAVLPARPLAIALVDGLFDTTPSVWHHELLAALDAGVAVFGGASMGALRAAELERHGVVGVGAIFRAYRDGALEDDSEVALLHGDAAHGFRPLTVPLVAVRAAAEAARAGRLLRPGEARAVVAGAEAIHYTERTWPRVLEAAALGDGARARLEAFLPRAADPKAADARACVEAAGAFVRARRAGAPALPGPGFPVPSHVRRARLERATAILPGGRELASGEVLRALARRRDAGALAADGLRRLVVAGLARSLGLAPAAGEAEAALAAWLARASVPASRREAFLAACGLDAGAARRLGEELALEARLLDGAARMVPDGPSWEEGLALAARLSGAWIEEALAAGERGGSRWARELGTKTGPRRRKGRSTRRSRG